MEVCGQEFTPGVLSWISEVVASEPLLSRSALSRRLCEQLGWRDGRGRLKQMSARVALLQLHRRGLVTLPPSQGAVAGAIEVGGVSGEAPALSLRLAELGPVELVLIADGDRALSRIWRGLLERHHPLGSGPLCGAQLRYLIRSARFGWLGGLAFSAPAWRLGARDRFIGWAEADRREGLLQVVANSRFLIAPQVQVAHLASHVLGRCLRRLADDWQARYGVRPLLVETFVDPRHHAGTCYRAANWQYVGDTRGRGRNDRWRRGEGHPKAVYLYPLCAHWRAGLGGIDPGASAPDWAPDWAEEEFGGVELGDQRLAQRLLSLARDCYARPQAQLPQACGSRAKTKAAYRFFDHPRSRMHDLLAPHYEATARRVAEQPVVLAVQDSSGLNYSAHPTTDGLGPLNTRSDNSLGLWLHDTLAFTPAGLPLGLLDVQVWARDAATHGKRASRYQRPIEEKESAKWLTSFAAATALQQRCPESLIVSVGDREADVYELFVAAAAQPTGARLLVRAERTRRMTREHGSLWHFMATQPVAGIQHLKVPRQGARPAREARLEVRFAAVDLKAPKRKQVLADVALWAVWTREVDPPEGVKPLEWMLLTDVAVDNLEQACERLTWYAARWQIEVYHRTLKSGCRVEERQLGSAKRLEACLAIDLVVAWRIFHLAKLGREIPDVPCTVFFEEAEWKALHVRVNQNADIPTTPPSLRTAIRMVASLGGFLGRAADGEPGTKSLWLGLQRLDDITAVYRVLTAATGPPGVQQTYG
jgi:hypothetical protein